MLFGCYYRFPDCIPSLAIVFCDAININQGTIKRMDEVQKQFKNSYAIVIGIEDNELWCTLQMMLNCANMRLFRVAKFEDAASLSLQCHKELSQKEKIALQDTYFRNERSRLLSGHTSRSIIIETLQHLNIPEEDALLLMEGYPTLQQIITTSKESLLMDSPASKASIDKVSALFDS